MKKYKLSNTSTSFMLFLAEESVQNEITEDHKAIYVWCYCDQDLFELGKLYAEYLKNNY